MKEKTESTMKRVERSVEHKRMEYALPRFDSVDHMLSVHWSMFGEAGRTLAEIVIEWAPKLFAVPLDPLALRIVLAPQEMGPYNRHTAYAYTEGGMILVNRHRCGLDEATGNLCQ